MAEGRCGFLTSAWRELPTTAAQEKSPAHQLRGADDVVHPEGDMEPFVIYENRSASAWSDARGGHELCRLIQNVRLFLGLARSHPIPLLLPLRFQPVFRY